MSRGGLCALAAWIAVGLPAASSAAAAAPAAPAPAATAVAPNALAQGAMSLGNPHAPVTVIEYASVGCPHCAVWANQVFPDFRSKYIDSGKVRFEFHEMLTGNAALAAAGFLTARCAPPGKYFQVVDDVFAQQDEIGRTGIEALEKIGEHAGLTREKFTACLQDQAALATLSDRTLSDAKAHGVTGTPTFFVGGQKLDGEQTLEALDAAIAHARR
ncbi:MAG: disulfide bond formation protein DsbA [Caulobacteraceae bacterium]|nr:disulfide bond formation protein DsbA [Caulobacteraceae bacterium]